MVGILCTVANENLKNQNSRASTPSDGNDSESTDKGFDPEVILMNIREKLVTVPKNGRKPIFHLGPNGNSNDMEKEIAVTKEVSAFGLFIWIAEAVLCDGNLMRISVTRLNSG